MIKLIKLPIPSILLENKEQWTSEYLDALNHIIPMTSTIMYRYTHSDIKQTLLQETHNKCAYCESKITHVSYGDIEHILPKSTHPDLYVDWNNLTISCEICNRSGKSDYDNDSDPLLNPYIDNPSDHLLALGPILANHKGSRKGSITIKVLDLNRTDLFEKRKESLDSVITLVNTYYAETNPKIKDLLKNELIDECKEDKEFSFFIKSYLKDEIDI